MVEVDAEFCCGRIEIAANAVLAKLDLQSRMDQAKMIADKVN
jgi:hypothetical protein